VAATLNRLRTGQHMTVHGPRADNTIDVTDVELDETEVRADALTTLGNRKLLVLLGHLSDAEDPDRAVVQSLVFGSTSSLAAYYKEASFGKMSVTGEVHGPFNLKTDSQTCRMAEWLDTAVAAAKAAGVDVDSFDYVMLANPHAKCPFVGVASTGGRRSMINGAYKRTIPMVHEFGHCLGLGHAGFRACPTCENKEYADPVDPMGNQQAGHFSAFNKERLGWLSTNNVVVANTPGTYTIRPLESASTGVQSLRVPRNDGKFYAVEFRRPKGLDSAFPASLLDGALVRIVDAPTATTVTSLIDMAPSTSANNDAALLKGATFDAPESPFKIKVLDVTSTALTVDVRAD
jgi:hypothetical protein